MRQFAAHQLETRGPDAAKSARSAHRDHFVALGEAAACQLVAHDQARWLDRLELELDNLRAAIAFREEGGDCEPGIRLVTALRTFFKARGHAAEGIEALDSLLRAPLGEGTEVVRARALAAQAYLLEQVGGYGAAESCAEEALVIARAAGDEYLVADLLDVRSFVSLRRGQPDAALPFIEEGLDIARRLGERHLTARLLAGRSFATDLKGDHVAAARDSFESVILYRQVGDQRQVGTMLGNLGYCELSTGELEAAPYT